MRGNPFHNKLVEDAKCIFSRFGWKTYTERWFCTNGITTYFDLFARDGPLKIACEIETTSRHAVDNLRKAQAIGMPLWIIVPTRGVRQQIQRSLGCKPVFSGDKPVAVILPDELRQCIEEYINCKPII
ncbi:MAG: hypothetical protein DRP56_06255 [Planctomycetota bacterium]|nr:MAG: hypothetical protein DRP56_06255 [Planctomycetota bacterium]